MGFVCSSLLADCNFYYQIIWPEISKLCVEKTNEIATDN